MIRAQAIAFTAALTALSLMCAGPLHAAARCTLMLDLSASMRGFAAGGPGFSAMIDSLRQGCDSARGFGDGPRPLPDHLTPDDFHDAHTYIGQDVATVARQTGASLIVVTDNVADTGAEGDRGQGAFYKILTAPDSHFDRIDVLLLRLPFAGRVWSLDDRHSTVYGADRALIVYVLGRGQDDATEATVAARLRTAGLRPLSIGLAPFRAAPADAVTVRFTPGDNSHLLDAADGIVLDKRAAGEKARFTAQLDVSLTDAWDFGRAAITAAPVFPASADYGPETRGQCHVSPDVLTDGQRRLGLHLDCTAPPPTLDPAQVERLKADDVPPRQGALVIQLRPEQGRLALGGKLSAWSFDGGGDDLGRADEAVQSRIYRLRDLLVSILGDRAAAAAIKSYPLEDRVYVADWSRYRALLPWLVLAAAIAGIVALVRGGGGGRGIYGADGGGIVTLPAMSPTAVAVGAIGVTVVALGPIVVAWARGGSVRPIASARGEPEFIVRPVNRRLTIRRLHTPMARRPARSPRGTGGRGARGR